MLFIDHMRLTGLIDADEYEVLSQVADETVAAAHRDGLEELKLLVLLHAILQRRLRL